jgi:hypothetical protein
MENFLSISYFKHVTCWQTPVAKAILIVLFILLQMASLGRSYPPMRRIHSVTRTDVQIAPGEDPGGGGPW